MKLFQRAFEHLEVRRARSIARRVRRFLEAGESVLDLGAGSLIVGQELERSLGVRVVGLETLSYRKRPLPMALYSGNQAPFRDGSFDCVFIAFVLHHCDDGGIGILEEARRLARRKILILEDRYDSPLERFTTRMADSFLNWLENPRIPIPHRHRPTGEWLELFREMGLRCTVTRPIRTTPLLRTAQVLFLLEKT